MLTISRRRTPLVVLLLAVATLALATPVRAAEISVLVGSGSGTPNGNPTGNSDTGWGTMWGGMLTISLFNIVYGEIEGAHQGGGTLDNVSLYSATAKAYIGPTIGRLVPYAGIGAGVYHESLPSASDQGTSGLVFAGVKLKFPFGLVVRGEYQWVNMPDAILVPLDKRYFFAAGLSF
jgi:hypothetical protein